MGMAYSSICSSCWCYFVFDIHGLEYMPRAGGSVEDINADAAVPPSGSE